MHAAVREDDGAILLSGAAGSVDQPHVGQGDDRSVDLDRFADGGREREGDGESEDHRASLAWFRPPRATQAPA